MNKFAEQIEKLTAVSAVVDSLNYYVKERTEEAEYYTNMAKEKAEDGNPSEDDYWLRQARQHEKEATIWQELISYLEKKYI